MRNCEKRSVRAAMASALVALVVIGIATTMWVLGAKDGAYAAASLSVTPSTGLSAGQTVSVTGTGLAPGATGAVLQCNSDPTQPTVALAAPVSKSLPVSCTGISAAALASTDGSGNLSASFSIRTGTVGPPCGAATLASCPATCFAGCVP
jgi:hypothetical protein